MALVCRLLAIMAAFVAFVAAAEGERAMLGAFSEGDTSGWDAAAFDDIPES